MTPPTQISQFSRLIKTGEKTIFDYALGASIVALLPVPYIAPYTGWIRFLVLMFLTYRLIRSIERLWRFSHRKGLWGYVRGGMALSKAFLWGLLLWVGMVAVGVILPVVKPLALGIAVFGYFRSLGQALQHLHINRVFQASAAMSSQFPVILEQQDEG